MRLLTLGGLDLRTDSGGSLPAILSQKKRVALLCYLAVRAPGSFVQRHAAAALFWPDSEEARARGALRNSLHYLRRVLGAGAIMARGDEEIALNTRVVWCDAVEFERAAKAGRLEEALALYRGPLLDGFLPGNLPEFTDWLDARRRALAWLAVDAAKTLADRASERSARAAVPWVQRWIELAPYEEPAIRALMQVLLASGDRASALESFDSWAARLRRDLGAQPSPETMRLLDSVHLAAGKPASRKKDGPAAIEVSAPSAPEVAPLRQRRHARIAAALAGVLMLGAVGSITLAPRRVRVPPAPTIAVLPFSYGGGEPYRYLGPGMVRLLSEQLATTSSVRAVEARAVLANAGSGSAPMDERRARSVARRFGATHFVIGSILELNGELQLSAGLYESGGRGQRVSRVTIKGDVAHLFNLVGRVSASLLQQALSETAPRVLGTSSLAATEAYLEGERAYLAGQFQSAVEAFERATNADDTFARAYLSLSLARNWLGHTELQRAATAKAMQYESQLSKNDRLLLHAWDAHTSADPAPAVADSLYTELLRSEPENAEAWYQLGEVRFHWGPMMGMPVEEAALAFERTLEIVPSHGGALLHALRLRARAAPATEVVALKQRFEGIGPQSSERLEARALAVLAANDAEAFEQITTDLWRQGHAWIALQRLLVNSYRPELVLRAARDLAAQDADVAARVALRLLIAQIEAARGAWLNASEAARAAAVLSRARAAEITASLQALPFVPLSDDLAASADALRRLSGPGVGPHPGEILRDGIYPPRAALLEGLLRLRVRDSAAVAAIIERLENFPVLDPQEIAFAKDHALLLRARVALAGGDPEGALQALGSPRIEADGTFPSILSFPKSLERWTRAEALEQLGRDREALRWYGTFPDPAASDIMFLSMAHFRRARIYDRLGELSNALAQYQAFMRLASPNAREIARELGHARQRIAQLVPDT